MDAQIIIVGASIVFGLLCGLVTWAYLKLLIRVAKLEDELAALKRER